jgi:hypothetical protein
MSRPLRKCVSLPLSNGTYQLVQQTAISASCDCLGHRPIVDVPSFFEECGNCLWLDQNRNNRWLESRRNKTIGDQFSYLIDIDNRYAESGVACLLCNRNARRVLDCLDRAQGPPEVADGVEAVGPQSHV